MCVARDVFQAGDIRVEEYRDDPAAHEGAFPIERIVHQRTRGRIVELRVKWKACLIPSQLLAVYRLYELAAALPDLCKSMQATVAVGGCVQACMHSIHVQDICMSSMRAAFGCSPPIYQLCSLASNLRLGMLGHDRPHEGVVEPRRLTE